MTIITSYATINVNYPIAGQDNDSQGFRNNFTAITNSFAQADVAISGLTTSTAKLNVDNDFLGNAVSHAVTKYNAGQYNPIGAITDNPHTLYFNQAEYHDVTISTSTTFQVAGWPSSSDWASNLYYAQIRLQVTPTAAASSATFALNFQSLVSGGTVWYNTNTLSLPYISSATDVQIWDIWTYNGGQDTYVNLVGGFNHQ
jgi:hypothetical protein